MRTRSGAGVARPHPDLDTVLAAAAAAPSMHNTQPWRFGVIRGRGSTARGVALHAATSRRLRVTDPHARALHLSCGAALLNLRLAVAAAGRRPLVRRLPDPDVPTLLAVVTFGPPQPPPRADADLAAAIPHRHTNRLPYEDRAVPASTVAALVDAARLEGASLQPLSAEVARQVFDLAATADRAWATQPAFREELDRWTTQTRRGLGVPPTARGPADSRGVVALRDFGGYPDRPTAVFEPAPLLAVLSTPGDTRAEWLRAGEALERVLLTATHHGLATSFVHQPLELSELRWLVRSATAWQGQPQMVLRLGYGPPVPPTPRLPLAAVVEDVDDEVAGEAE